MIEKVNPEHPDKVADRIAGAIVDLAYKIEENPKIAVEVLIGHGKCHIIAESSVRIPLTEVWDIVRRITKDDFTSVTFECKPQDSHLADNQSQGFKCGDYREIDISNSVIYCDPPYRGTAEYADNGFNHNEFDDWVRKLKYDVFISEYDAPFEKIASFGKLGLLNNSKEHKNRVSENLYYHKGKGENNGK